MKLVLSTTAALMMCATGAVAQGFAGASVAVEYFDFNDSDADASSTLLSGAVEYEAFPGVSFALDVTQRSFEGQDEGATNVVLHGIYAINPNVKVGAFVGRETVNDNEVDNYGIEAAYSVAAFEGEVYVGAGEVNDADLTYFGIAGDYGLGNGFSFLASYDGITIDNSGGESTIVSVEIGGQYALSNGLAIFATAGNLSLESSSFDGDENYYTVGASFAFGGGGGTTFSPRGLFSTVPFEG